jgi:hypothetical protein
VVVTRVNAADEVIGDAVIAGLVLAPRTLELFDQYLTSV